jgi:hypothetical protein
VCMLLDVVYIEVEADWASEYEVNLDGIPRSVSTQFQAERLNRFALHSPFYCYACDQSFGDWHWALQHLQDACPHFKFTGNGMDGAGECHDCGARREVPRLD